MAIGSDGNLYVLDAVYNGTSYASEIRVWPANSQGNIAPTLTIPTTNAAINPATSYSSSTGPANAIGLDGSNNLYVGLLANPQIVVFAPGANGSGAAPIRTISTTDNGAGAVSHYLFVNANGSLIFVAGPSGAGNTVGQSFAAGANGAPTPTATFQPYYSSGGATLDISGITCGAAVDASGTFYIGIQGFPPSGGAPAGASAGILEVSPAMQSGRQQIPSAIVDTALTNMQTPCVMQVVNGSVYATDFNTHKLLQYPSNGNGVIAPTAALQLSSYGPAVLLTTPYSSTSAI
jgi:hypothetical protein